MSFDGVLTYASDVGSYVGTAVLLDDHNDKVADVRVSLARADADGDRWFGSVQGLDPELDLDGHDVFVELPVGSKGRAKVVIDLTGAEPLIRLVGTGPAPV
jgi:hypothetical protein